MNNGFFDDNVIVDEKRRIYGVHFDSMVDLIDMRDELHNFRNHPNYNHFHNLIRNRYHNDTWLGPTKNSIYDMIDSSVFGDHELYEKYLKPMIAKLKEKVSLKENINNIPIVKRQRIKSSQGDFLDIHRVNSGNITNAWDSMKRETVDQDYSLYTLLIDVASNCGVSALDTLWTSASCLYISDILQKAGKSTQIIVGGSADNVHSNRYSSVETCCIKRYNQHLSIERLAAMSNVGMYRSSMFILRLLPFSKARESLGRSIRLETRTPLFLEKDVLAGNTKLVHIKRSLNISQAVKSILDFEEEISKNSKK